MSKTARSSLRDLLAAQYDSIRKRLARRLGSDDLAGETLHETYLRFDRPHELAAIEDPVAYLYRAALNVAESRRRSEARLARRADIEAALQVPDSAPGPGRAAEGALEVEALTRALAQLPERRRAILIAARLEEVPHLEIARRFGISRRTVLLELKRALAFCEEQTRVDGQ